jgi:hypothetical protein
LQYAGAILDVRWRRHLCGAICLPTDLSAPFTSFVVCHDDAFDVGVGIDCWLILARRRRVMFSVLCPLSGYGWLDERERMEVASPRKCHSQVNEKQSRTFVTKTVLSRTKDNVCVCINEPSTSHSNPVAISVL